MARISLESPRAGRKDVRKLMQQEVGPQEENKGMSGNPSGNPSGYVSKASAHGLVKELPVPCSLTTALLTWSPS